MKREIKFRVWDYRKMIYDPVISDGSDGGETSRVYINPAIRCYDYIIMQYTGLKDKNGKEIYEGDIVITKGDVSILYVVKFGQYMYSDACFFLEEISDTNPPLRFFSRGIDQTEIIGNIYENPELL